MEIHTLEARPRTERGTRASWRLRQEGRLPAVVYGVPGEAQPIHVDRHALETILRHHERVVELRIDGGRRQKALIQDLAWDHLGDTLLHVDFKRLVAGEAVEVEVELEFIGHARGQGQGELVKSLQSLLVQCSPESIPESIPVLITELDVNEQIHVRDLELPEGVRALTPEDEVVVAIHARTEAEEEEAEAPEGEESAEPEVISRGRQDDEEGGED